MLIISIFQLGLAGFSVHGFPVPFVGGSITTSVLANLDLLNHQRPLNSRKLVQGDAKELSILYHRLIELNKLASAQFSTLGDPYYGQFRMCFVYSLDLFEELLSI